MKAIRCHADGLGAYQPGCPLPRPACPRAQDSCNLLPQRLGRGALAVCLLALAVGSPAALRGQTAPQLVIDTGGHKAVVRDVMFTPDGRYLISASEDKTVRVWDVMNMELSRVLRGETGPGPEGKLYAAALSPDARLLAVAGHLVGRREDKAAIRLLDLHAGIVIALLRGHTNVVNALAFSRDGRLLLSGSTDGTARVWDMRTRLTAKVLQGHAEPVYAVAVSPDGRLAVSGSDDDTLRLWSCETGAALATWRGHAGDVTAVAWTPDGRHVLSGGADMTIRMWRVPEGGPGRVVARQKASVEALALTPDGRRVVTGIGAGAGTTNHVFAVPDGRELASFGGHADVVLAVAVSPDGTTVATAGGANQEICLWDIRTGALRGKLEGRGKPIWRVAFSADGRDLAWGHTRTRDTLFMYGPLEQSFRLKDARSRFELGLGRALRSDGDFIGSRRTVGPVSISTPTGTVHATLQVSMAGTVTQQITRDSRDGLVHRSATLTPDGATVISGGSGGALSAYDVATGVKRREFVGHSGDVFAVSVSPDGRLLMSGSDDQTVKLWDVAGGTLLLTVFESVDNEWVAWTPAAYYASSVNGDRYIGWHVNRGIEHAAFYYPATGFSSRFYSPVIAACYLETRGDIAEAIRLANAEDTRHKPVRVTQASGLHALLPPVVSFRTPAERHLVASESTIRVDAVAKAVNDEPITDIWLLLNGRPLHTPRGIAVLSKPTKQVSGLEASVAAVVPLSAGQNRIAVMAANRYARSEPELIIVERPAVPAPEAQVPDGFKPDMYVLAVGVSTYREDGYDLDSADQDAQAVARVLQGQEGRLYERVVTRVLVNAEATRGNVLDGLDWVLRQSTQRDVSVIFVAGHGLRDEQRNYYFLPHDGAPESLRRTAVKWSDFQDVLASLPSKTIFLVDTCHSGSVSGKRRGVTDMGDALRELVNAESGVIIMTASTGKEESQERPDWGHGAFTLALVDGLGGKADVNGDRVVDVRELDLYVTHRVKALTNGTQHPMTELPKTMPNFPLIYH